MTSQRYGMDQEMNENDHFLRQLSIDLWNRKTGTGILLTRVSMQKGVFFLYQFFINNQCTIVLIFLADTNTRNKKWKMEMENYYLKNNVLLTINFGVK